jgi:acetyl coenzyme A synthetase (ADP forming)-like protein
MPIPTSPPTDTALGASYPHGSEAHVALRDGSTVHVRPIRTDDGVGIRAFLDALSPDSLEFRFFGIPDLTWVTNWSLDVDYADRFGLVVETGTPARIVAHAAYLRTDAERAEVAFMVADEMQGFGISTTLLAHLAAVAEQQGITTFTAEVRASNHRMIDVFRESGFPVEVRSAPDAIHVEFPTSLSPEAQARFEERDRIAAVEAVRRILEPRSVAVVGASRSRESIGGLVLHNLLTFGFNGRVYAVNTHADTVQSLPAYRSVGDLPGQVDLALIVVPAEHVVAAAKECAAAGVGALVVISAGFSEVGGVGAERQAELLDVCRSSGMRMVGPNCLGVLNTDSEFRLNGTFASRLPRTGPVGFMSQSGGLGIAIIEAATRLGIGLSSFVSVGNKADLSGNDLLCYWEQDPSTAVAMLYLESFGNPRKFARVAPRFARQKPLLAVKSGRSAAGARAGSSHTGALIAASDVTVDALFEQAGVIRADTLHELFAVAQLVTSQPIPAGDRVAIVTNAGGPGVMCADACQTDGVDVSELPSEVQAALAASLAPGAAVCNPIDMVAGACAQDYRRTLTTLIDSGACDAILAIYVPTLAAKPEDVATVLREIAENERRVTIAAVFMTADPPPAELSSGRVTVPGYEYPEEASRAVAMAARYGRWRATPEPVLASFDDADSVRATAIISGELAVGGGWMRADKVAELLHCYGLPLIDTRLAADSAEASRIAAELGKSIALKASSDGLLHKSDAGGVLLGLSGDASVRAGAAEIEARVRAAGYQLDGLLVQPMAPDGVELIVGVVHDRSFGPVIACGAGGTAAELTKDVAVRITPIGAVEAAAMIRSLRSFPLLDGYRGAERCAVTAVEDVILRVSAMVEAHPEIAELDCNPVIVTPTGAVIVDARVRIEAGPLAVPRPSLRA